MKRVYIEPAWKLAMSYQSWITHPPQGYQFLADEGIEVSIVKTMARMKSLYRLNFALWSRGVPVNLLKAYLGRFKKTPPGVDLTLAATHLVFRQEPWVLDMQAELPAILVGPEWHFSWYRGIVRRALLSPYCKRIITHVEAGKRALVQSLDREEIEQKIVVIYPSVPKKTFAKSYNSERIKLLFVNSANIPGQFDLKGGKEALEAFVELRRRYAHLDLVMRSDIPPQIEARFQGLPGLRSIEEVIPWEELEREFQTADIFILPAHFTPSMAFLDAMSYELPVVTLDVWGSGELVEDGKAGFVVPKSSLAPEFPPEAPWGHSRGFGEKVVRQVDPKVVQALVQKLSLLIENPELRQRMGRAGRREVEEGKFSIATRNEALKRVLDEATEGKN